MGISEGKIILYSVIGGVDPKKCLPVCLDVGTNRASLLADPEYTGVRQKRLRGEKYDGLVEEFITSLKQWQPNVLLQVFYYSRPYPPFVSFALCIVLRLLREWHKR